MDCIENGTITLLRGKVQIKRQSSGHRRSRKPDWCSASRAALRKRGWGFRFCRQPRRPPILHPWTAHDPRPVQQLRPHMVSLELLWCLLRWTLCSYFMLGCYVGIKGSLNLGHARPMGAKFTKDERSAADRSPNITLTRIGPLVL